MLQEVLTVAAAVLHLADDADELRMQAVDAEVDGGALACLNNLVVKLLLHFCHHLLDASGVDASVCHELMQGQTAGLAAHRVEAADDDGLGCVVDDDFHTAGSLQGANVATLTAYDAAFHVVVVDVEHRHTVLNGCLSGYSLDGLDNDLLSLSVSVELGLVHDFIDVRGSGGLGFVLQTFNKAVAGFLGAQTRELLQLLAFLLLHLAQLLLLESECFLLVFNAVLLVVEVVLAASKLFLLLVQRHFALLQLVLALLDVLVALLHFLFQLALLVEEFLLHLEQFLFLDDFRLFVGRINHFVVLPLDDLEEEKVSACHANGERDSGQNNTKNKIHKTIYIVVNILSSLSCQGARGRGEPYSLHGILYFRSQLAENIIVWGCIVLAEFFLIPERYLDEGHQRDGMVALAPFVDLCVGPVALGDELGSCTVVLLILTVVQHHCNVFIIDVQPYIEFLFAFFCHCVFSLWACSPYFSSLSMVIHLLTLRISDAKRSLAPSRSPSVISNMRAVFSDW